MHHTKWRDAGGEQCDAEAAAQGHTRFACFHVLLWWLGSGSAAAKREL